MRRPRRQPRQMRIPSWNILMNEHSSCVGDKTEGGGFLNLQLNPQEGGGMILFCYTCGKEICGVRNA